MRAGEEKNFVTRNSWGIPWKNFRLSDAKSFFRLKFSDLVFQICTAYTLENFLYESFKNYYHNCSKT